jgi:hypothetical protein
MMTEDQLEQETLGWFADIGYSVCNGFDISPDDENPERKNIPRWCWLNACVRQSDV